MTDSKTTFLFDGVPAAKELARRNDPEESKKAAREIAPKLGRLHYQVLTMVKTYPDHTVSELSDIYNQRDPRYIGRRLPELARTGKVYKSGSKQCYITHKTAATWRVCR